ncbi:MAG: SAM-dependent DNA methyltransferase [Chthonomonadaceae bacterium]|nr:MAG: SAM-dependent DNA methyltransferase [Chthonomonadaceae bacterium]
MTAQIKSKERVAKRGEVLTGEREVNAILDLVKQETERIESRFLEPACGTGNFLVEILRRKLAVVDARYKRSRHDWERSAVVAVSSIYGIDIDEENVGECRDRLFVLFAEFYERRFRQRVRQECRETVRYLLARNIIWGDALDLKTVGPNPGPIIFSEWSPVNGSQFKRRDYAFHELFPTAATEAPADLFGEGKPKLKSDTGQNVFIPEPVREYPPVHFLEIGANHE